MEVSGNNLFVPMRADLRKIQSQVESLSSQVSQVNQNNVEQLTLSLESLIKKWRSLNMISAEKAKSLYSGIEILRQQDIHQIADIKHQFGSLILTLDLISATNSNRSASGNNSVSARYNEIVHLAKTSKRVSNRKMRQFTAMAPQIFNERIDQLRGRITNGNIDEARESIQLYQEEIAILTQFINEHPGLSTNREKIICLDILIEDVVASFENKFCVKDPATLTSNQPRYEISKTQDAEGRTIYRLVSNQPPPIKNICLRGGGGKGLGYVGMLSELARQGKLDQLESVAGSSAGGIASMALSIGVPCDQLGDFCVQVQKGIDKEISENAIEKMPFLKNQFKGLGILGSAAGIIPAADNAALKSVGEFLKTIAGESNTLPFEPDGNGFKFNGVAISSDEKQRLEQLFANYQNPNRVINEGDLITFADLALLKRLDTTGSHHFRDLTLTGWDGTDQKEIYFNAQNYPNMPIAYATRITMALPGAFKRVDMDIERFRAGNNNPSKTNPDNVHRLFDGGLGSNSPSEVFIKPLNESSTNEDHLEYQKAQQETLTCIFDADGEGYSAQSLGHNYSESLLVRIFLWLLKAVSSPWKMKELRDNENEKLDKLGNEFVVGHGHLGTLSMNPRQQEVDAANLMSALQAIEFCRQRKDQVYYLESPDPRLFINEVPVEFQHALRAQIDSFEINS